jgi:hypothetical protein
MDAPMPWTGGRRLPRGSGGTGPASYAGVIAETSGHVRFRREELVPATHERVAGTIVSALIGFRVRGGEASLRGQSLLDQPPDCLSSSRDIRLLATPFVDRREPPRWRNHLKAARFLYSHRSTYHPLTPDSIRRIRMTQSQKETTDVHASIHLADRFGYSAISEDNSL